MPPKRTKPQPRKTRYCEQCGEPFKASNYLIRKGYGKYCGRKCSALAAADRARDAFWTKMDSGTDDECWPWKGHLIGNGYGQVTFYGKVWLAHRLAYHLAINPVSSDVVIMHTCDNPTCCNPNHLQAGTQSDNIQDMYSKGRGPNGSRHKLAKLTEDQVRKIKAELAKPNGLSQQSLADIYGVSRSVIGHIHRGKAWKHVK